MVAHHPRVQERFVDGIVWVTVGADTAAPDLAATITSTARLFDPAVPQLTEPLAAGAKLGQVLGKRRVLLVVDDVWSTTQVEPFLLGGDATVRLFTTRQRDVLPRAAVSLSAGPLRLGHGRGARWVMARGSTVRALVGTPSRRSGPGVERRDGRDPARRRVPLTGQARGRFTRR